MKKAFFSIGIIFKNEIRCLERCLKSLQPLRDAIPCEVVMADTGSDDGSREIAEKYADILFDFVWCDDFAAARNAVMDRCSGEWYFSIDADEWLGENVAELAAFSRAKKLPRDFGGVMIRNYKSKELEKGQNFVDFVAVRMVRLSTGIRYHGCIHECWNAADGSESISMISLAETWLYHDGYVYENKAEEQKKLERNLPLLKKKLAENPDDIKTLIECVDSAKRHQDAGSEDYARHAVELVNSKAPLWDKLGAVVFRNAVSVAQLHKLPELKQWAEDGLRQFPESVFVRIDLAYYTFAHYFDEKDYTEAARWGELYQQGMADYQTGHFDGNELTRGVVEFISPFWERKVSVLMPQVYLELDESEKALVGIRAVKGQELEDPQQVELCVNMLMRIQRTTFLDAAGAMASFWEQINRPFPDEAAAEKRRTEFLRTASNAFTHKYRDEEVEKEDFQRRGYSIFAALAGRCEFGTAAAILETEDRAELEELLNSVEKWEEFPIAALEHALERGARFPLPGKPLKIEEMDTFTARMARSGGPLAGLAVLAADEELSDWQPLAWARGLALAAVKSCDWESTEQGMELCRAFAKIENIFLPKYYAAELFSDENIHVLPPMHRFGWYCGKAFWALDAGDSAAYVRLLRRGLEVCPEAKPMVEFLLRQLEESQKVQATPELLVLAEQVRALLAQYPADDPAVEALKQSAAYQKVARLIEGPEPGMYGGIKS